MKKILLLICLATALSLHAQDAITLTFTGEQKNHSFQRLDSVRITNITNNWTEVIYYPDTVLIMNVTGITSWGKAQNSVKLFQNKPNPFQGNTTVSLLLTEEEPVSMTIYDINGKHIAHLQRTFPAGEHQFQITLKTPQVYLLGVVTSKGNSSIKMINTSSIGSDNSLQYAGSLPLSDQLFRKHSTYKFSNGNQMEYTGYTTQLDGVKEVVLNKTQNGSETITFTFPNEEGDALLPEVQTLTIDQASGGIAEVTSKILSNGGAEILEAGIICSTDSTPNAKGTMFKTHFIADDGTFTSSAVQLTQDIKYTKFYVRAYARNAMGTAYGNTLSFIVNKDFQCGDNLYDVEGNAYPTVKIGSQCWTAANMRTKSLPDGTKLLPLTTTGIDHIHGRYYYEHTDKEFGTEVYYPWSTACNWMKNQTNQYSIIQGICPDGWHVPTYREYVDMLKSIDPSFNAGSYKLDATSSTLPSNNKLAVKLSSPNARWTWYKGPGFTRDSSISIVPNTPGYNYHKNINDPDANSSGFSVKPSGYWKNGNVYYNGAAQFWTAMGTPTTIARTVKIAHNETGIIHYSYGNTAVEGYSVRCVYGSGDPEIPVYPSLEDPKSFSMIFLSDPQTYSKFGLNQPLFELQTAWTAMMRNKLNILTTLISGDFVEQNDKEDPYINGKIDGSAQHGMDLRNGDQSSTQQWEAISRALNRLDNVLPYVPCQGNHDCGPLSAEDRRSKQPEYIYPERNMLNEKHIVSMCPNHEGKETMENVAFEFNTDTWGKLLIIGFEFAPRDEALNWAKNLIESDKYKEHRVIIFTHSFLNEAGDRYTSEGYTLQPRNWAQAVWDKLIYPSKNIMMVLCGHSGNPPKMGSTVSATDYSVTCSFRTDKAANGRLIPQMMFNAQHADGSWHGNGGDGWLRIMEFKPDGETVSIKTFSPLFALSQLTKSQAWRTQDYDQFTFKVPKLR